MNKILFFLSVIISQVVVVSSCENMNDLHEPYLENGEIDYVSRLDSISIFAGDGRIKFDCSLFDMRVKNLTITWKQGLSDSSVVIPVPDHELEEKFSFVLGEDSRLTENNHTFTIVTDDGNGVKSIPFSVFGNVYGEKFQDLLIDRDILDFNITETGIDFKFSGPNNANDIGFEVLYYNTSGELMTDAYYTADAVDIVSVVDYDSEQPISYRTLYLPEVNAIDTFRTETLTPSIDQLVNVALGKPTTSDSNLNDSYTADKVVDGIKGDNASRWINARVAGEHWIEIDLLETYPIERIKIYDDTPIGEFTLQAEVDGVWIDLQTVTGSSTKEFTGIYSDLNANKVRYAFETSDASVIVRMFEFEVLVREIVQ